jgi:16S rRNA (cytosine1402-N4)-methyltransferase
LICTCKHEKTLEILTKKPIEPSKKELLENTRSRSAKARAARKIKV